MQLIANAETIDRLVEQGVDFSKAFHAEYEKDPTGPEAQFLRGEFSGWRSTLHTEYHDGAEEIVDRVLAETCLPIPAGEIGTDVARASWLAPLEDGAPTEILLGWATRAGL